jgi:hypothetical protein
MPDGSRVHLEAMKCGGALITSSAAIARFLAAQNPTPTPVSTTTAEADAGVERALSELAEVGI